MVFQYTQNENISSLVWPARPSFASLSLTPFSPSCCASLLISGYTSWTLSQRLCHSFSFQYSSPRSSLAAFFCPFKSQFKGHCLREAFFSHSAKLLPSPSLSTTLCDSVFLVALQLSYSFLMFWFLVFGFLFFGLSVPANIYAF